MEVQMRQFEQLQQILKTTDVPIDLLRHVEMGNAYTRIVSGGGYLNHKGIADLCLMYSMLGKANDGKGNMDTVSSLMEYNNYTPKKTEPVVEPKKTVARKKKMAING